MGYRILARNYQNRFGEIDLIARDGAQIVFVEVRGRSSTSHGHPAETVGPQKQRKITRAAAGYLNKRPPTEHSPRFDVVTIIWDDDSGKHSIQHFKHAFQAAD